MNRIDVARSSTTLLRLGPSVLAPDADKTETPCADIPGIARYTTLVDEAGLPHGRLSLDCAVKGEVRVFGVLPVSSEQAGRTTFILDLGAGADTSAATPSPGQFAKISSKQHHFNVGAPAATPPPRHPATPVPAATHAAVPPPPRMPVPSVKPRPRHALLLFTRPPTPHQPAYWRPGRRRPRTTPTHRSPSS